MGNWNKPALPDPYPDFLDSLIARDLDCGTLFITDPANPPVGIIRYNRSLNLFQEWNGSSWVNKILAQAGGGTGLSSQPSLGTMASQNANNVAITGGDIRGLSFLQANGEIHGSTHIRIVGQLVAGSSQIILTAPSGKLTSLYNSNIENMDGQHITNMNAGQLTHGTVYRDRLGSGATGSGTRVLMDNGTWVDKNLVGGGMVEIVHNDTSFGSGEVTKPVIILWAGPMPTSIKKISVVVNSALVNIRWKVTAVNQFEITLNSETPGIVLPWTAYHHITQV